MTPDAREALDAYYAQADSWGQDRSAELARSRRVAWMVAAGAGVIALAEAVAIVVLVPLKTVEPYTLLVDRHTGFVQALEPLHPERLAPDTALTQSFLVQYVIARESFDIAALQSNYRRVVEWSEGNARTRYIGSVQSTNPESPLARLPRNSVVETRVKSVSPLSRDTAMVRFETQRRDSGGQAMPAQAWVAVIRYRYSGEPLEVEDRYINPLGFKVAHYQRNAEAVPAPDPVAARAPTAGAPSPLQAVVAPTENQAAPAIPSR